MSTLTLSSTIARDPDMISADMDGEVVMMSIEEGVYYGLTGVGPFLWRELETPLPIQALCDKVLDHYEIDASTCQADVLNLMQEMLNKGIVKEAE